MLIIPALACWLVLLFRLLLLRLPLPLAIFVWINAYLSTYLQHLPCTYETDPSPSPGQGPDSETKAQCQRQSPLRFSCPSLCLPLSAVERFAFPFALFHFHCSCCGFCRCHHLLYAFCLLLYALCAFTLQAACFYIYLPLFSPPHETVNNSWPKKS